VVPSCGGVAHAGKLSSGTTIAAAVAWWWLVHCRGDLDTGWANMMACRQSKHAAKDTRTSLLNNPGTLRGDSTLQYLVHYHASTSHPQLRLQHHLHHYFFLNAWLQQTLQDSQDSAVLPATG